MRKYANEKDRDRAAQKFDLGTLRPEHLAGRPRRVGRLGAKPVFRATTTGGLTLVLLSRDGKNLDGIGAGSHPEIAMWVAERREPGIVWEELRKSEPVPYEAFAHLIPKYERLTDLYSAAFRKRWE